MKTIELSNGHDAMLIEQGSKVVVCCYAQSVRYNKADILAMLALFGESNICSECKRVEKVLVDVITNVEPKPAVEQSNDELTELLRAIKDNVEPACYGNVRKAFAAYEKARVK